MEEGFTYESARVFKTPVITYALIALNVFVYLVDQLLYIKTGYPVLFVFGSKINEYIVQGQYWRLVTPMFLHGGALHLAVNAYSLYVVGPDVEKVFGRVKFIVIYIVAGLLGNVASFAFCPAVSVGASGAIFGLLGALLYMGIAYKDVLSSVYVTNIITMIVLNLAYGFLHPQIDNYAHMGGLLGGCLSAYCLGLGNYTGWTIKKSLALLILGILVVVGIFLGFRYSVVR
jgi:Uncharacterized membrane protein (homolog of Drosophila rhomboid)